MHQAIGKRSDGWSGAESRSEIVCFTANCRSGDNGELYRQAWQQYQQDKNLDALISAVARTYATAPQYAEMVEEIAAESNVVSALPGAVSASNVNICKYFPEARPFGTNAANPLKTIFLTRIYAAFRRGVF
jgi:hypothetical protein